jgi:hypothetical protein
MLYTLAQAASEGNQDAGSILSTPDPVDWGLSKLLPGCLPCGIRRTGAL